MQQQRRQPPRLWEHDPGPEPGINPEVLSGVKFVNGSSKETLLNLDGRKICAVFELCKSFCIKEKENIFLCLNCAGFEPNQLVFPSSIGPVADPGGSRPPLPPRCFFKSCSFQAILRENPYFEQILGSAPPAGVKTLLGPPDQNPGPQGVGVLVARTAFAAFKRQKSP